MHPQVVHDLSDVVKESQLRIFRIPQLEVRRGKCEYPKFVSKCRHSTLPRIRKFQGLILKEREDVTALFSLPDLLLWSKAQV